MNPFNETTPSGVRFLREERRWRRRLIERTWWAVLATGLAVLFMLVTAKVPSGDDVIKGIITASLAYWFGDKQACKKQRKGQEAEEEDDDETTPEETSDEE